LNLFKAAVTIIGVLLFVASVAPLAAFSRTVDVNVSYRYDGRHLVITVSYDAAVSLYDARVAIYSGGDLIAEASDPVLEPGESLTLRAPLEALARGEYLVVFEGRISGLYWFSYEVSLSGVG